MANPSGQGRGMTQQVFARIAGTGSYLPEKVLTNDDLAKLVDTSDEWIAARTGIRERHVAAEGETTGDLAYHAAVRALEAAGVQASELDLIVLGTTTPDLIFPSTACLLQHRLGANGCPAFDVNAACSGFVYALTVADKFIRSGAAKTALVIGAETLTRMVDWTDRTHLRAVRRRRRRGRAQGRHRNRHPQHAHARRRRQEGIAVEPGRRLGRLQADEHNAGVRIQMSGNDVFKHAVKALDSVVEETLEANGLDRHDIDWLIPHQANLRIIEATAKRLDMPMERVVVTVDKHGNTSSGSVPLALDEAVRSGKVQRGQLVLLEAFGGGFTWGSALLRY